MLTGLSHSYITKADALYRRRVTNFPPLTTKQIGTILESWKHLKITDKEQRVMELSDKGITQKFVIIAFHWNLPCKHYFLKAFSNRNTL